MIIGGRRPEEARVYNESEGDHPWAHTHGVTVFWHNGGIVEDGDCEGQELAAGWYWVSMKDFADEASGPFGSSTQALYDAQGAI